MKKLNYKITLIDEMLGTAPADKEVYSTYIASTKTGDELNEEVEALENGIDASAEKERKLTIFCKNKAGNPILWDYQWKGYFKDTCKALKKVPSTKSSAIKAYKQEIDGNIFVFPRQVEMCLPEDAEIGICERPLRAQTMQGERIALAASETVPAGSTMDISVVCLIDSHVNAVKEWMANGIIRGTGQWRNSGKGRFIAELTSEEDLGDYDAVKLAALIK